MYLKSALYEDIFQPTCLPSWQMLIELLEVKMPPLQSHGKCRFELVLSTFAEQPSWMKALCCRLLIASMNHLPAANLSELVLLKKEVEDRWDLVNQHLINFSFIDSKNRLLILDKSFGIPTQGFNTTLKLWIMTLSFSNWRANWPLMMTLNLRVCHLLPLILTLALLKNNASPVVGEVCHQVS